MYLKHIRLSGFKSFVDLTTVSVPARVIGVVGPNGCGKSNIIDAIRWVMGEGSAKTLRGDSMADVIFNGSSARKPVGKAMVELVFDNSEGKAPGPYAKYSEISIRRELSRDGQSTYLINKTKCRRRDITDIFLGTGLGPRSYSIIEQGMVGRIVEAKPEELRVLVEEAAGVSKYKDRRRETETRIRHTRENLERVADIRSELDTQLRRLKRQSGAAERYKTLRAEERLVRAQLLSLRWQGLGQELEAQDEALRKLQTGLDEKLALQRNEEKQIEQARQAQGEANERFNGIQAEFYRVGGEISGIEQKIEHARQTQTQHKQELERVSTALGETTLHLENDQKRLREVQEKLSRSAPQRESAQQTLEQAALAQREAQRNYDEWQLIWEGFSSEAALPEQEKQVQIARIEEHEARMVSMEQRQTRLQDALTKIGSQADQDEVRRLREEARQHDDLCAATEAAIAELDRKVEDKRGELEQLNDLSQSARDRYHAASARLDTLKQLHAAAMDETDDQLNQWLENSGIDRKRRLTNVLQVDPGWELALDRVMGKRSMSIRVDDLTGVVLPDDNHGGVFLIEEGRADRTPGTRPSLADKVRCESVDLGGWLDHVLVADDFGMALGMRDTMRAHESVVTKDGVWVGKNWIALANSPDSDTAVLTREKEIADLESQLGEIDQESTTTRNRIDVAETQLSDMEEERSAKRRLLSQETGRRGDIHNRLGRVEARALELNTRRQQLEADLSELGSQLEDSQTLLDEARRLLDGAEAATKSAALKRDELNVDKDQLKTDLERTQRDSWAARDALHEVDSEYHGLETQQEVLEGNINRLEEQRLGIASRQTELRQLLGDVTDPGESLQSNLEELLRLRVETETRLKEVRTEVEKLDESIRTAEQNRSAWEQQVQEVREQMEDIRIGRQEILVRRDTVEEQVRETDQDPSALLGELPEDADESLWEESLDKLEKRIDRIGPVNLVAIEEYEEQAERKVYLDKQYEDLTAALATLESVIQKIDRETKAKFKETFENLNVRFQQFFPRLFGGGSAYLELTDADLLDTGVAVMARPPGKRNSTIHLLSGGEKALTAVALLFSFFDLNPAPFCVLDEVDAPLDDANVERYSEMLKTLSDRTQLIFITHNKITMECASILIGVTMMEPGVSRLVSVDVEEAMDMVAQ